MFGSESIWRSIIFTSRITSLLFFLLHQIPEELFRLLIKRRKWINFSFLQPQRWNCYTFRI